MRSRLCKSIVATLLIISIGGHWAILQSVAWVSMVVSFSKDSTIEAAVVKTFDGKHPCNICKMVRHGKAAEKKHEAIKIKSKMDVWIPVREFSLPTFATEHETISSFASALRSRSEPPPFPPPRWA